MKSPASVVGRYPTLSSSRPPTIERPTQLNISGVSSDPASVAVAPSAPCAKSGTNEMAPNIATPARNPATTETSTTRLRNRASGTMGSGAPRSTRMKSAHRSAAPPSSARLRAENRVRSVAPPSTSASISSVIEAISSAAPA